LKTGEKHGVIMFMRAGYVTGEADLPAWKNEEVKV
jgi:hypothetical protein